MIDWDHQRPPRADRTKSWAYRSGRLRWRMAALRSSRLTRPSASRSRLSKNSRPALAATCTHLRRPRMPAWTWVACRRVRRRLDALQMRYCMYG